MIRQYLPADLPALRRICVLTGDSGRDATGRWSADDLLPDVYLEPYVTLAPDTAWVVDLGSARSPHPVGYLVAALDTAAFAARWAAEWSPEFAARHPQPAGDDESWLHDAGRDPLWMLGPQLADYPAHLHIDLLPEAQGGGFGRGLMRQLGAAAVGAGVRGIHLGMDRGNLGARAFYDRLGFHELPSGDEALLLGIDARRLL